ncbi:hypothetical protein HD806DRAFT_372598 [Xylariaceae sp. AK1471]|nr:hypothetical protein HD806DRAFT_372598 [Xylariaceae sp. AK1471]
MCITDKGLAPLPSHGTGALSGLPFRDLVTHNCESDVEAVLRSYPVTYSTPLGSPPAIINIARVNTSTHNHDGNPSFSRYAPQQLHNCQNKDCQYKRFPPEDGGSMFKRGEWRAWLGETGPKSKHWGFDTKPQCLGQAIFTTIFNAAFYSGIAICNNPACLKRKEAYEAAAPPCKWIALRDFMLTCLACMVDARQWGFIGDLLFETHGTTIPRFFCLDIRSSLDVFMWSHSVARRSVDDEDPRLDLELGRQKSNEMSRFWRRILSDYESDAVVISQKCHDRGLCPNRLWNASLHGGDTAVGVCHLGNAALGLLPLGSRDLHVDCTAQYCLRAHENSTLIKQAHKCADSHCGKETIFHTDLLNQASKAPYQAAGIWFNTAWRLRKTNSSSRIYRMVRPGSDQQVMTWKEKNYMALSHVWSDGTGVGLKTPGKVNKCLYGYFAKIARKLGCDGLWWDAISIPSERTARATAIERMLDNFEKAKVTVIHDYDLVRFPWRDDGSPAIALVLSSWFTRGWTAAELFASRHHPVKVLYADPANPEGSPLIKDWDGDVFATDAGEWMNPRHLKHFPGHMRRDIMNPAGTIPKQGYFVAAEIVKILRHPFLQEATQIGNLSDLLKVLSSRTTSWTKDQMLIAALMCQDKNGSKGLVDSTMTGPEIMKFLLVTFEKIRVTDFVHSEVPIATHGPWSWCPQSVFHFGQLYHSSRVSNTDCIMLPNGRISCRLQAYEVLEDDVIISCGSHPAIRAKVSAALSNRPACLLLSTPCIQDDQPIYILSQPVFINNVTITVRWVACVQMQSALDPQPIPILGSSDTRTGSRRRLHTLEMNIVGINTIAIEFEFGNDITASGIPLSPLTFNFLSWAAGLTELNSQFKQGTMWILSVDMNGAPGTLEPSAFGPQPIYFYDYGQDSNMFKKAGLNMHSPPVRPMTLSMWDFDNEKSRITASFLEDLMKVLSVSQQTNDTVNLTWSFPYYYKHNENVRPTCAFPEILVFETTFRIVPEILVKSQSFDVSFGSLVYNKSIVPHQRRWRKNSTRSQWYSNWNSFVWSSKSCGQCGNCKFTYPE